MTSSYISKAIRERVRRQAGSRCGYCLSHQRFILGKLEIEHIIPQARGGSSEEDNLWLSCRLCNGYKGTKTYGRDPLTGRRIKLFNPRRQKWSRHFAWSADVTRIIGLTVCGRATAVALQLNNIFAVMVRRQWVGAGWHPPQDLN
jgi:hypothetical protein